MSAECAPAGAVFPLDRRGAQDVVSCLRARRKTQPRTSLARIARRRRRQRRTPRRWHGPWRDDARGPFRAPQPDELRGDNGGGVATVSNLCERLPDVLDAIAAADWDTYELLRDPGLTAFEPEARGHRVEDATPTAPTMARRIHLDR